MSASSRVEVVQVSGGMTNIWGLPEFVEEGKGRFVVIEDFRDEDLHRLPFATWFDALWKGAGRDNGFVDLIFRLACNIRYHQPVDLDRALEAQDSFLGSGGRTEAMRILNGVTPEEFPDRVNRIRARHRGRSTVGNADITFCDGAVYFRTARRMREFVWEERPNVEVDSAHPAGTRWGKLMVDFKSDGSHQFLLSLIRDFGMPMEALQAIQH